MRLAPDMAQPTAATDLPSKMTEANTADKLSNQDLALVRTQLANERTALAYVRTSLLLAATGVTVIKIYGYAPPALLTGGMLLATALVVAIIGGGRYLRLARVLK